jgi:hypothetical protein
MIISTVPQAIASSKGWKKGTVPKFIEERYGKSHPFQKVKK